MCTVAFSIPSEVLYDTRMNDNDTLSFARKAVALEYYRQKGLSLGYCAEIAGLDKEEFIRFLGENGISIYRYDSKSELLEDVANA